MSTVKGPLIDQIFKGAHRPTYTRPPGHGPFGHGSGCKRVRVWGLGIRVAGLAFEGLGFEVQRLGFRL